MTENAPSNDGNQTTSSTTTGDFEALTNTLRPVTDCFLTIRVIKSFEYRTTKNMLLPHVNAQEMTVGQLKQTVTDQIKNGSGFKAFRNCVLDTLKIYTRAHGAKTTNLIINFDHDEDWILDDDERTLESVGIENEYELSFFNRELYEAFKKDPTQSW